MTKELLKRKLSIFGVQVLIILIKLSSRLFRLFFTKRTILFVTNQKIRSITIGPLLQIGLITSILWTGHIFMQSLHYNQIINSKSEEISRLESVNKYFEEEFDSVNEKLRKISEYLVVVTGTTQSVNAATQETKKFKKIDEKVTSKTDKHTLREIKDADVQLNRIQSVAQSRIKKIEKVIGITGLNIRKIPNEVQSPTKFSDPEVKEVSLNGDIKMAQGGPADYNIDGGNSLFSSYNDSLERELEMKKFNNEIDYLVTLEKLINVMPLSKPMRNYYISSGFGYRSDPLTRRKAVHKGVDFVGVTKEKIISPSQGVVTLAGRFSNYGNAVVIDHGFGVTTRYGHLSEVKVREGQIVKRGDVIATQGSTGRSTGPHLHYEVRYKNTPLNPRRFLEAGEYMFNEENNYSHVNS